MATQADVRRIALSLPEVEEAGDRFAFSVLSKGKPKGFVWPAKFFTEPHSNGFPAVLVLLDAVNVADLRLLIAEAWRCQAPAELTKRANSP